MNKYTNSTAVNKEVNQMIQQGLAAKYAKRKGTSWEIYALATITICIGVAIIYNCLALGYQ